MNHQQTTMPAPAANTEAPAGMPFSNARKTFPNLFYCYTHGYDVDHPGHMCPAKKYGHRDDVTRDNAHEYLGACMKGQHKTLPDGTGGAAEYHHSVRADRRLPGAAAAGALRPAQDRY